MLAKEKKGQKVFYKLKADNRIAHSISKEYFSKNTRSRKINEKYLSYVRGKNISLQRSALICTEPIKHTLKIKL